MDVERTGKCLCGAVSYTAKEVESMMAACHCGMCRRWTGGPFLSITAKDVAWTGEDKIKTFTSSPWAERGFCSECGTTLFYRVTAAGPHQGVAHIGYGTLDDQSGFEMGLEFFIDIKPDAYDFAGERKRLTEAEVMALFSGGT
ncbi:MAG: GFA family protein [Deltaproteobacteria bacterium]|jgi:hypothetical protein|nr:GFA family protein [Deltaproteobacteria bacterium]MBW2537382.1 GFA family protein [Deltaproteobacteria bacterium]